MANKWNIPKSLEETVRRRDVVCVYCGIVFGNNSCDMASWEHINNKAKDVENWNIALCCRSCNSSKGVKKLESWFETPYCLNKNINKKTVADIVRKYIEEGRE
jgi:transcription initiation factor TFIIIB Brf1 subunit/transcription initiation factor TFIIB